MAKTAQESKGTPKPILAWGALAVAVAGIVALLSYDIWGEKWLGIVGRTDNSARPHQHEELGNLSSQNINIGSRLQALERSLESLQDKQQAQEQVSSTLEALQTTLAEQHNNAEAQQEALQALQDNQDSLQQQISENPQTLSVIISMIGERRRSGLALDMLPDLLAGSGLGTIADDLRIFASEPIPTDEELLQTYEVLRPEIALALGGTIELPTRRNFLEGAKAYVKSLVQVRKLGQREEVSDFANLSHAIEARNFRSVYELAQQIDTDSADIEAWLVRLQLRHQADVAVLALHENLADKMLKQLGDSQ